MFDFGLLAGIKQILAAWQMIAWIGIGGLIVIACGVVAFLRPSYAYVAAIVGVIALGLTIFYGMGVRDATRLKAQQAEIARKAALETAARVRQEAEDHIRKQVENEQRNEQKTKQREKGVGGKPSTKPTARSVPNDRYNRDLFYGPTYH